MRTRYKWRVKYERVKNDDLNIDALLITRKIKTRNKWRVK
jgi:hypothetical protein